MAASKSSDSDSAVVKFKDENGRVHFTARGSAAHERYLKDNEKGKVEDVPDQPADAKTSSKSDADASAPAAG